jgi:hypothetical protein
MCAGAGGFQLLKKKETASNEINEITDQFCTEHTRQELMRALSLDVRKSSVH